MEPISIVIFGIIVVSGNFLQYLLHSRCKTIKTPCCEIERDVITENKINEDTIKRTMDK